MGREKWLLIITLSLFLQLPLFFIFLNLYISLSLNHPSINLFPLALLPMLPPPPPLLPPPLLLPPPPSPQPAPTHTPQNTTISITKFQSTIDANKHHILTPHGIPHYTFVDMSTYRASYRTFFVIGITSVVLRKAGPPIHTCEWHPNTATRDLLQPLTDPSLFKTTAANVVYISYDEHGDPYAAVVVNCTFAEDVGKDGYGGLLTLSVAVRGRTLKSINSVVYREKRKEVEKIEKPHKYNYTFCGPPIFKCDQPYRIVQWLTYHNYIFEGSAHYFFYNVGGITKEVKQLLDSYVKQGLLTIIDAEEQESYLSWYHNQVLFINDCLHRSRYVGRWALFHDLDEFLYVEPPQTLRGLLEEHNDKSWVTYGNVLASTRHCRAEKKHGEWAMERMICRASQPECKDRKQNPWKCIGGYGRRKYAAQTGKVVASGVHQIAVPSKDGVDVNASMARIYHYRGLLATTNPCSIHVDISLPENRLRKTVYGYKGCYRDNSVPLLLHRAKLYASLIP